MKEGCKLGEMLEHLLTIDDVAWGLYAFSRELLKKHISHEEMIDMTQKAIACGKEYAKRMIKEIGSNDAIIMAKELGIKVESCDEERIGNRVLFAHYTKPSEIKIMKEPIIKAMNELSNEKTILVELFQQNSIINTILGHEIFHVVEDKFEREIYTRVEKIVLWNFLGLKNYSTIRALSEIAAMSFTKELNAITYSPFLLDILLYYGYDQLGAETIYRDVLRISAGR